MNTKSAEHSVHITPLRVYLTVGIALLVFTAVTVKVSTFHLGSWNAIAALAIASIKALLVALFFMHLIYDKKIYMVVVSVSLIMLGILIALTMADILRRGDIYDYQAHPINPEAKIYGKLAADTTGSSHGESHRSSADTGRGAASETSTAFEQDTSMIESVVEPADSAHGRNDSSH